MSEYSELKRLAEAAPTGPWISENDSLYFKDDGYTRHLLDADAGHDVEDECYYAALSFIAAANPSIVLALIAENEALRGIMDCVVSEIPNRTGRNGNAPGHCHYIPGVWDRGNGAKTGTECGWCKVWNAAVAISKELKD